MQQPFSLAGQRVAVLGGSAGIGLAIAEHAARLGAEVVVASSNRARLDRALAQVRAAGGPGTAPAAAVTGHVVDLRDEQAIAGLFAAIGAFDHLAYTAGENLQIGALADTDFAAARRFFDVRYWGALAAVKYAAPQLRAGGSVTLTSGIACHRPSPGWTLGASITGAVESLTRALAVELAPVRVNCVSPGLVETELWASLDAAVRAELFAGIGKSLPVRRIGQAADLAPMYIALMTGRFATGQVMIVDGGGMLV